MLHNTSSISSSSLPFSLFSPLLHLRPGCWVWSRLRQRNTAITQSRWGSVGVACIHEACEKHTLSSVSRWDSFSVSALFYSSFTFSFLQQSLCLFHPALLSTPLKCRPSPPFLLYALLLLSPFLLLFDFFCRPLDEALLSLSCCTLPLTPLRSHSCM